MPAQLFEDLAFAGRQRVDGLCRRAALLALAAERGEDEVAAATALLSTLTPDQRAKAVIAPADRRTSRTAPLCVGRMASPESSRWKRRPAGSAPAPSNPCARDNVRPFTAPVAKKPEWPGAVLY